MISSTLEPRLLERRRSVEDQTRRRRVVRLAWLAGVAAVIGLAVGALFSPLLDVDRVEVDGPKHLSPAEVRELAAVEQSGPLVSVDLRSVRSRLMQSPWVASARVGRHWPGTVRIVVTEETPLASVVGTDGTYLVSTTGRVLKKLAGPEPGLVSLTIDAPVVEQIRGGDTEGNSAIIGSRAGSLLRDALVVLERTPVEMSEQLSEASLSKNGTISFHLADDAEIRFGHADRIAAKLIAIQAVLSQVTLDCMTSLDVREPTRPAVGRGPGCPGVSPEIGPQNDAEKGPDDTSEKGGRP